MSMTDTLFDAVESINSYYKEDPKRYAPYKDEIEKVKEYMTLLCKRIDRDEMMEMFGVYAELKEIIGEEGLIYGEEEKD